jgi:hypothetical protein
LLRNRRSRSSLPYPAHYFCGLSWASLSLQG